MMLCGRRVESGVIVPWDNMVGEDVVEGKEAVVMGEYPREFNRKVSAVENVVLLIPQIQENVHMNGEG
jgi:hypothetical protein